MNTKELKEEVRVNENDLQGEWSKQATLFLKYSLKMSRLIHDRDTYRREVANKILVSTDKISEAALTRMLDSDAKIIDFQLQINQHKNAVQAFEHKKKALEYEER